jgi:hypothetical protein
MIFNKGCLSPWIHNLPSIIMVIKKCKVKGTTWSLNLESSNIDILIESIHCQSYAEDFILLSVMDRYINVSLSGNQMLPPHLPELISP